MKLWYQSPARDWFEGLPIGTGRLAAMVLGACKRERVALNHEWLWTGVNRQRDNQPRHDRLASVRQLLLERRYAEGTQAANDAFAGMGGMSRTPGRVDPYQPAGDLYVEFEHGPAHEYHRELDLDRAVATVSYRAGKRFTREYLAHLEEDQILMRVRRSGEPFQCALWLDRLHDDACGLAFDTRSTRLVMDGAIRDGVDFRVQVQVCTRDGDAQVLDGRKLLLRGVTEVVLAINIGVKARGKTAASEVAERSLSTPLDWEALVAAHVASHRRHFGSMRLELALSEPDMPTDERLRRLRAGAPDPALAALYFDYGRYLLCASSANAELPANLQGKWNEDLRPPWDCDYHHDINLQMCYWIAETTGMQRYAEALFQHIERFVPHARKAAMDLYGCRGVLFPIQTDAWGRSTPESFGWAVWIGAAPWLAQHLWWHYEFGLDADFLCKRAYPFFKDVASFYEDYLVADAQGVLQIVPSQSPENRFVGGGDLPVSLGVSSTMDVILAREALRYALQAAEILGVDAEAQERWRTMRATLPELKIGRHGQLQEWNEDFDEVEPEHRHVSHLIGVHPGDVLDPERTPELWRAAEVSLTRRLAAGGGHTGWSRSWVACLFARLGRREDAWEHLQHLITDFATDSLLDLHPPRIFQIDGNLGGTAAVVEMLLQSYHGNLHLLPALPAAWPEGRVDGLRARGGFVVGMHWCGGALTGATITSTRGVPCRLIHAPSGWRIVDAMGRPVAVERTGDGLAFPTTMDVTYTLLV
ncbi:MAG: glycoside hydrolase family 95 protein [Lentisphaerae bacterium]|nr:glycoside hydrolase family 95 protein [Lentisphaerota bacterium]